MTRRLYILIGNAQWYRWAWHIWSSDVCLLLWSIASVVTVTLIMLPGRPTWSINNQTSSGSNISNMSNTLGHRTISSIGTQHDLVQDAKTTCHPRRHSFMFISFNLSFYITHYKIPIKASVKYSVQYGGPFAQKVFWVPNKRGGVRNMTVTKLKS